MGKEEGGHGRNRKSNNNTSFPGSEDTIREHSTEGGAEEKAFSVCCCFLSIPQMCASTTWYNIMFPWLWGDFSVGGRIFQDAFQPWHI